MREEGVGERGGVGRGEVKEDGETGRWEEVRVEIFRSVEFGSLD